MARILRSYNTADEIPEMPLKDQVRCHVGFCLCIDEVCLANPWDREYVTEVQKFVVAQTGRNILRSVVQDVLIEFREQGEIDWHS
jgi:hypothetical protein